MHENNINDKIKIMTVFGTRPEAVKMAPLVDSLEKSQYFDSHVCVTAQHRDMLDQVLDIFGIEPDFDLDIMQGRQTLQYITSKALEGLCGIFDKEQPDMVLVHGDTTTTFAASLAAFYNRIRVGHVEAGLRTFDKYFPYPEEINRKLTGVIADVHFSPTEINRQNLVNEGVDPKSIYITGNTVIDALKTTIDKSYVFENNALKGVVFEGKRIICVTAHRRENLGEPLENICNALDELSKSYKDILVIYPVHLNPAVRETAKRILGGNGSVILIDPLNVRDMHNLMDRSYFVMTDSGGLQEEAPSLGKPVLVLRGETERPEAVKAGTVALAGTRKEDILYMAKRLIENKEYYDNMAKAVNPYGDGRASERITNALLYEFGISKTRPPDFNRKLT
jgi:UDP-N-acetylglucosamine 2-epimerase (non-hydrolysing)